MIGLAGLAQFAQAQSSGEQASSPVVSVEFTVVGWAGEISNLAYPQGGHLQELKIPAYARSKVYKYTGPAQMGLYLVKAPGVKGETSKVATVAFTDGAKRVTVLIAGENGQYQVQAASDDEDHFPMGHARVMNLCPVRVLVRCNQADTLLLQSNQVSMISPRADHLLVAETAFEKDGEWKRANDDFIPVPADAQTSVFFVLSVADHFKSSDGVTRALQMVILREKPVDRQKVRELAVMTAR